MVIKMALLVLFLISTILVGLYSKKHTNNVNDFVLGGRDVGPWLTAFAYGTSYFSAVVFVGYAGRFGWNFGLASTWIGLGNAAIGSLLAWIVLGRRTRVMTNHLKASTMPEYFEKRYKNKNLRMAAALISFFFLIPYTASVYNGLSYLFEMAFKIPFAACIIIMAIFTTIYVILGGYKATAINDFIQGIIMIAGIIAVVGCTLEQKGGFLKAVESLSKTKPMANEAFPINGDGIFASFFGPNPMALLSVIVLTSLGTWGLPQMVQKFYAIKSEKSIKTGTIISTFFAVVVAGGCYFLGGFARLFSDKVVGEDGTVFFDRVIPTMLSGLPDIIIGVVIVLVLSASMSTLASLVLTSSTTIALDFVKGFINPKISEKAQLLVLRTMIFVFVALSVLLSLLSSNGIISISDLMGISWGALAGAFLGPFMYGLYWKGTTGISVWASFISGVAITVGSMLAGNVLSSAESGALAMIVSLIIVPVVSLITPKMDNKELDEIFACYEEKVVVTKREAYEEQE
ncbi:MAG: sodium:solute symporter family protein [Lachnospiraceae bacterium]|nr:sodium:solute symporter family protein [Lachnospiraceae bacterium]